MAHGVVRRPDWTAALLAAALAASAAADEPAPEPADDAAGRVLAAVRADDAAAIEALANRDEPDPWLVADALLERGEAAAAERFARASGRTDVRALPAHVLAQRDRPDAAEDRAAVRRMNEAYAAGDAERGLDPSVPLPDGAWTLTQVRLAHGRGQGLAALGRGEEAAKLLRKAGEEAHRIGWLSRAADAYERAGSARYRSASFAEAIRDWEAALAIHETRARRGDQADALCNLGNAHLELGAFARALELQEASLRIEEELGREEGIAASLVNLANVMVRTGRYEDAIGRFDRALVMLRKQGKDAWIALALGNLAVAHESLGRYEEALEHYSEALKAKEALGLDAEVPMTLNNLGALQWKIGSWDEALETLNRAVRTAQASGNKTAEVSARSNRASVFESRGDLAKALAEQEKALAGMLELGNPAWVAQIRSKIGLLYGSLGDLPRALEAVEGALASQRELVDEPGIAATLANLGGLYWEAGRLDEALRAFDEAIRRKTDLGDRGGAATAIGNKAIVLEASGDRVGALAAHRAALAGKEEVRNPEGRAITLGNLAAILARAGEGEEALHLIGEALRVAEGLGARDTLVVNLSNAAEIHGALGDFRASVDAARRAVEEMSFLVRGQAQEHAALARERRAGVFETGVTAAARLGDVGAAAHFLESGRAGALLEALGGRHALRDFSVPRELADRETLARAEEAASIRRLARAESDGVLAAVRTRRAELEKARGRVRDAVGAIQRAERGTTSLAYPKADPIDVLRGRLRAGEALVVVGSGKRGVLALVATRGEARLVQLGPAEPIEAACEALRALSTPEAPVPEADALRKLAVDPLALPADVRRVYVSPDGGLAYVPLSMAFADREVVLVPSGTTYGVLRDEATAARGEGVLALGDPAYPESGGRGRRLVRLPGTRDEAKAIGDVVLLGAEATETRLRAELPKRSRWRAVHLACHGFVDPVHPLESSLALAPDEGDGFLDVLDVFRTRIPADLVVLSACETGAGGLVKGEGMIGLARAFMFAGAPRVLCSLWEVDDEATLALMRRFYELWSPRAGRKEPGLPAAEALRKAQDFVREQEKWRHPFYWAAWMLWGLGD